DERELTDLRHGDARQERRLLAVAEPRDDPYEDQRVADQHEQRQHDRSLPVRRRRADFHLDAERDEEDQDEEVDERLHLPPQVLAVRELRQADPREERADLYRQRERLGHQHEQEAPEQAPDEE